MSIINKLILMSIFFTSFKSFAQCPSEIGVWKGTGWAKQRGAAPKTHSIEIRAFDEVRTLTYKYPETATVNHYVTKLGNSKFSGSDFFDYTVKQGDRPEWTGSGYCLGDKIVTTTKTETNYYLIEVKVFSENSFTVNGHSIDPAGKVFSYWRHTLFKQ